MSATASVLRRKYVAEVLWGLFAAANLAVIVFVPDGETVPFHVIWVSLTLLYGYKVWGRRATSILLAAVSLMAGGALYAAVRQNGPGLDELAEVPLMAAMFVVVAWHAQRTQALTQELVRLGEREREFIRHIAHEVRTTITVARGHAELIRATCAHQPAGDRAVLVDDTEVVIDELARLAKISSRLMLFAAKDEPDFIRPAPIDLTRLIEETARRWRVLAPRQWHVEVEAATLVADSERLECALDALLENAVRHTHRGDSIGIAARVRDESVVIEVSDTGEGIPQEDLSRIFDRYAQPRERRGTGLGLAIVRAIVEAHGGSVGVESTLGEGTTFLLRLPGNSSSPVSPAPPTVARWKPASAEFH